MPGEQVPKTDPKAAINPDRIHHRGVKLHADLTTDHRRNRTVVPGPSSSVIAGRIVWM